MVGGGVSNSGAGLYATIGGGENNVASSDRTTIAGGANNIASGSSSTVGGGFVNTASGYMATVGGGDSNTASGWTATVGGGWANTAIGTYSSIPGGRDARAFQYGQVAHASGSFAVAGDAQASSYVLRTVTNDATETPLFLDGASERLAIAPNSVVTFDILVAASSDDGESAGYRIQGVIENVAGVTSFVGVPSVETLGEDNAAWDVAVDDDDAFDALVIEVTGAAGADIRWVATARTAAVSW
jgi:hypothetical protein